MSNFEGKFKHYIITALRALSKHWFSSALSLLGLAAAFSLCIISAMIIWKAYSSDSQWGNASQIYVLERQSGYSYYSLPYGFIEDIRTFSPDIIKVSGLRLASISYKVGDKKDSTWAQRLDETFFEIFSLEAVSGDFDTLIARENMVALSQRVATEIYGDKEAVGQILETSKGDLEKHYTVGAVYKEPENTTLIRSRMLFKDPPGTDDPYSQFFLTLKKGADVEKLFSGLDRVLVDKYPGREAGSDVQLRLVPLKGAMLLHIDREDTRNRYLGLYYSSLLMLLVAILNYVSLSTVVAATRSKDIALIKILGASSKELTIVFILEMLILMSLAYALAIGIAALISPYFSTLTQPEYSLFNKNGFNILSADHITMFLSGWAMALLLGLIASIYPVYSMVHSKVIHSLQRARQNIASAGSKLQFILLTLQSLCGLGLTFFAGIIYFQIISLEVADKGFDDTGLLYIHMWEEDPKVRKSSQALVAELRQIDGVENATMTFSALPLLFPAFEEPFIDPITGEKAQVPTILVGDHFIETMKISLVSGQIFSAPSKPEEDEMRPDEENIFVNERFVRNYQMGNADEILDKCLYYIFEGERDNMCRRITAVVGDHFQNLNENPVTAVVFVPKRDEEFYEIIVRYNPQRTKEIFNEVEKVWDSFSPEQGIYYNYLDDIILEDIRAQKAIAMLVVITAVGALFLTIAGLYAMAKFIVARRRREIAIRRVLGAKTRDIVTLVVIQLARPIIIGAFFGLAIGWYYAMDWLTVYSIRIEPEPWHAVIVGVFGVMFFLVTTTSEILYAVRIRPAEALHYE